MVNFPKDKLPPEYNQEILTRQIEDIYGNLGGIDNKLESVEVMRNQLEELESQVSKANSFINENKLGEHTVMPIPENLKVEKIKGTPIIVAWCDPIEIIKYPHVRGYQFFVSQEKGFTPLISPEDVRYTGTHDGGSGVTILSDTADLTESSKVALKDTYVNLKFWYDMSLSSGGTCVCNTTQNTSGLVTAWSKLLPWQMQTDISWDTGDEYRMTLRRPRNLLGQGPLPFAVGVLSVNEMAGVNPMWDGDAVYVKARTYGQGGPRFGRYSEFAYTSNTTSDDLGLDESLTVTAVPHFYAYYIQVTWTRGHTLPQHFSEFSHYNLYRTTANNSNLLTDDTYLIAETRQLWYRDNGYDTDNPTGPEPDITYYYWIRQVDVNGNIGDNSVPDNAVLAIASDIVIYDGLEEEDRGWGRFKAWRVFWYCPGGAEGYYVRHRIKLNGTYGIWTLPVYIAHTTEYGLVGGEDIQSYAFQNLLAGKTYTFAVRAVQNAFIPGLNANWVTQDYTITNTSPPAAPT